MAEVLDFTQREQLASQLQRALRASHYCDWDAPGRREVRALCGAWMRRTDHANLPTCDACRAELARRDTMVVE